jgi:hypothetical protein
MVVAPVVHGILFVQLLIVVEQLRGAPQRTAMATVTLVLRKWRR